MGTASTVVDGQDLLHVAVCHIASVVLCQPGDGLGMHRAQPENQPFPTVFALIQSQKTSHAVQDARQERIRIAAPRIHKDAQHFPVKGSTVALVDVVGRADAVDFPRGTNPIQCKADTCVLRYRNEIAGVFFVCHQFGTEPLTSGQFAGNACLHSEQQSFMLFGKAIEDLAANREVTPTVARFPCLDGVLPVKDEVAAIAVADFRFIGDDSEKFAAIFATLPMRSSR